LGQHLLGFLNNRTEGRYHLGNLVGEVVTTDRFSHEPGYPMESLTPIKQAVSEALAWLLASGLIVQELPEATYLVSRRGKRMQEPQDFIHHELSKMLPQKFLHSALKDTVWIPFIKGEFDVAVFLAMKAVEVAVRDASKLPATEVGTSLARRAFHADTGVLTDQRQPFAEREALAHLFAGAIGYYKNPQSHRDVEIDNPLEALEIILLANHLLKIVDSRRSLVPGYF
jgi:uncharacterized protein (TIGR02391 family)